jgi:hypothetical protein
VGDLVALSKQRWIMEVPEAMQEVAQQFEQWRSSHSGRRPIPEALWKRAADLARQYGVFRTSKVLRLDYSKLKRQMTPVNAPVPRPPPTFVEFLASQQSPCACIIELEGPRGTMRIEWNGATAPDLCGLSRALGGAGCLIQIAPKIRILVAVEPIDARKGIDGLAQLCREKLSSHPFSGSLFIFRSRRGPQSSCSCSTARLRKVHV